MGGHPLARSNHFRAAGCVGGLRRHQRWRDACVGRRWDCAGPDCAGRAGAAGWMAALAGAAACGCAIGRGALGCLRRTAAGRGGWRRAACVGANAGAAAAQRRCAHCVGSGRSGALCRPLCPGRAWAGRAGCGGRRRGAPLWAARRRPAERRRRNAALAAAAARRRTAVAAAYPLSAAAGGVGRRPTPARRDAGQPIAAAAPPPSLQARLPSRCW